MSKSEIRSFEALHAGDKVLIHIARNVDVEFVHKINEQLKQRFPGIEFTFLTGVDTVMVEHG